MLLSQLACQPKGGDMKTLFNKLKQSEIFYGILVSLMVFPMGLLIIACADTAISWRWTKVNTTLEAVNLSGETIRENYNKGIKP